MLRSIRSDAGLACDRLPPAARPSTGSVADAEKGSRLRLHYATKALDTLRRVEAGEPAGTPHEVADANDRAQAHVNREAALQALEEVRLALHSRLYGARKSSNKWSVNDLRDPSHPAVRPLLPGPYADARLNARRAVDVWTNDANNCERLDCAVQDWMGERFPGVQTSRVAFCVDHGPALIGTLDQRFVTQPLIDWPKHLYICDPWANIACPAPEYPEQFARKMEKWIRDDKLIQSGPDPEWELPDAAFIAGIARAPQFVLVRTTFTSGQVQEHALTIDGKRHFRS